MTQNSDHVHIAPPFSFSSISILYNC